METRHVRGIRDLPRHDQTASSHGMIMEHPQLREVHADDATKSINTMVLTDLLRPIALPWVHSLWGGRV